MAASNASQPAPVTASTPTAISTSAAYSQGGSGDRTTRQPTANQASPAIVATTTAWVRPVALRPRYSTNQADDPNATSAVAAPEMTA